MTGAKQLLSTTDREELHDLIVEHAWLLDHGRWHDVANLYVDDGTLSLGGHALTGRAKFLSWADRRATNTARRTHHQCTNIRLRADIDGQAAGTVMLVLHVSEGGAPYIEFVGEYRDRYQQADDGRWRFVRRALHPLVEGGAQAHDTSAGATDA